ncbi:hypothetical protein Dxin01_01424 [Deinococcus xinjiangensis]|uniref:DUF488 domain-containing protein n=1 Tax=Deinococcus xinjiangensis TaxID=457454 RepID=A0ABP9V8S8_9DEIO
MSKPLLYTIGYEQADLHDFLATLRGAGVQLLVDVRERAQSRRSGYSKTALGMALGEQGIAYRHLRPLGTPPALRKAYHLNHDFEPFRAGYLVHLATQGQALEELAQLAAQQPTALLCYEAEASTCHRSLLVERMQKLELVGEVVNLAVKPLPADHFRAGLGRTKSTA